MAYVAHAKRARVDSYDNNDNHNNSAGIVDHKDRLVLHIHELYLRKEWSDIEFIFGSDVIPGHKAVICVNSKWRQLLRGETSIDMEDTPLTPFKELLRYLYTGRLNLEEYEPQMLTEMRQLAERFEMRDLCSPIQDMEDININLDNVLQLYTDADIVSNTGRSCLAFIAHNVQDVLFLDDFYDLPEAHIQGVFARNDLNVGEQVVFEAVKRYVTGSGTGDKNKKEMLDTVRPSLLGFEYLWTNVRKFCEENKQLMSIEELSTISAAKAKLTEHNPEVKERSLCIPGLDVIALRTNPQLSTRVLKGKVGEIGDEADVMELDLGLHYLINGLGIVLSNTSKTRFSFKVETSVDHKNWDLLYDFTEYHTSNKLDLNFNPLVLRFIRLTDVFSYADWAEKRKDSKPVRRIQNIVAVYEEPTGLVKLRDHLLASKYLFSDMSCDFQYKSWFKKNGKNFYVCALNDPIVCILSQPVWMDAINLYFPEEEEKEFNFTVEVTNDRDITFKAKDKGWQLVGNYKEISKRGEVEITFEPTVVNVFRVIGTRIVNPISKKDVFAVEIRI